MIQDYRTWAHLNDEGVKEFGDVFPGGVVPIRSMIPIAFTHPDLKGSQQAYILDGSELAEENLNKLIDKIAAKFNDPNKKDEIRKYILGNQIAVRTCLTSGAGTKNIHLFMPDFDEEDEEYEDLDWDEEDDWDEAEDDRYDEEEDWG